MWSWTESGWWWRAWKERETRDSRRSSCGNVVASSVVVRFVVAERFCFYVGREDIGSGSVDRHRQDADAERDGGMQGVRIQDCQRSRRAPCLAGVRSAAFRPRNSISSPQGPACRWRLYTDRSPGTFVWCVLLRSWVSSSGGRSFWGLGNGKWRMNLEKFRLRLWCLSEWGFKSGKSGWWFWSGEAWGTLCEILHWRIRFFSLIWFKLVHQSGNNGWSQATLSEVSFGRRYIVDGFVFARLLCSLPVVTIRSTVMHQPIAPDVPNRARSRFAFEGIGIL